MKTLVQSWNPVRELNEFNHRLSSLFNKRDENTWSPAVDVAETDQEFVITAELPGIERERVRVTVSDGVLSLSGERKFEPERAGQIWRRVERSYGAFARGFTLPDNVEADKVAASYKDGVLSVSVPKSAKAQPREVEVKIS